MTSPICTKIPRAFLPFVAVSSAILEVHLVFSAVTNAQSLRSSYDDLHSLYRSAILRSDPGEGSVVAAAVVPAAESSHLRSQIAVVVPAA